MEGGGITERLIFIRRIGLFFCWHFRVSFFKTITQKSDMSDDSETICMDGKFICIAEIPVDVLLLYVRAVGSLREHQSVSHPVRIDIGSILVISFQPFNQGIESFGIVFHNIKLNSGGVEGKGISKGGITHLVDQFGEVDYLVEHLLDIRFKGGLKTEKRGASGTLEKSQKSRTLQRISPFPPKSQVKGMVKISGDELGNIKRIIEKLEKGRGIFPEHVLAVRKGIF